jgi:hypothetical protein
MRSRIKHWIANRLELQDAASRLCDRLAGKLSNMKSPDIQRRLLLGSAVGALALTSSRAAQADTHFTKFSFAATGAPALRTLPDRLSEVVNVKDWGAVGNGVVDDTAGIQNAIDYCINTNRGGKIFFPPGTYKVSNLAVGSNSIDCGVQLIGSGQNSTQIVSTASGFVASSGGRTYDCLELISDLSFQNNGRSVGAGCIQITRTNAAVYNSNANGYYAIDASNCTGARIECIASLGGGRGANASDATTHGFNPTGTIAIQLGDNGFMCGCRAHGFGIAYTIKGTGAACLGCAAEVNNIGVRLGWSSAGASTAYACTVEGLQTERTCIPIEMYDCEGCYISSVNNQGSDNVPDYGPISSVSWSAAGGGTVTVNTTGNHNIPDTPTILIMNIAPAWRPDNITAWVLATVTSATQFTYPLVVDPTATSPAAVGWKYPLQYSTRIRKARECVLSGISGSHLPSMASVDLDYGAVYPSTIFTSDAANAQMRNVVFETLFAPRGWRLPNSVRNLGGCKFLHCTGVQNTDLAMATVASPVGQMTFADLPGQSGVFQTQLEGQTCDIKDGAKSGGGSAVWNDQVQGGGTGHYLIRTDGTNWFRIG